MASASPKRKAKSEPQQRDWLPATVVGVCVALVGLLFATPRHVRAEDMPLPKPEGESWRRGLLNEHKLAAELQNADPSAKRGALFDVRKAGEWLRRYGKADAAHQRFDLQLARQELVTAVAAVKATPDGEKWLLRLRAYQLTKFLQLLRAWEADGKKNPELVAIGGDFVATAKRKGWVLPSGMLLPNEAVRAALFKRRFAVVTGLVKGPFRLSVDEKRALYGFYLAYPPPAGSGVDLGNAKANERAKWTWLLGKAKRLAAVDEAYPGNLALGVAYMHLDDPHSAVRAFRVHLREKPAGPYTLRARNYLAGALHAARRKSRPGF